MKIIRLSLVNFKGIRDFSLDLNGKNARILGDNATGKTTIYDAFLWLLSDKDSSGSTSFGIKTRGEDGLEIHHIDHSVKAVLEVNRTAITLTKTYREKWVKKRGRAEQEFEGHEAVYEVDGVPKTAKEFQDVVDSLLPDFWLRLLTNQVYFNDHLKWQERRKLLLDTFGDITIDDVVKAQPEISELPALLDGKSIEDFRKVKKAERKRINDELTQIPGRIDEATRAMPDVSGDAYPLSIQAMDISKDIEALKSENLTIENGGAASRVKLEIANLDTAIAQLKAKHVNMGVDLSAEDSERTALLKERAELASLLDIPDRYADDERRLSDRAKALALEWKVESGKAFSGDMICPTCGQEFPPEKREELIANFNRNKAEILEAIKTRGVENGERLKVVREKMALAQQ